MLEERCYAYIYIFIFQKYDLIFSVLKWWQCEIFVKHLETTVLSAVKILILIRLYVADRAKFETFCHGKFTYITIGTNPLFHLLA